MLGGASLKLQRCWDEYNAVKDEVTVVIYGVEDPELEAFYDLPGVRIQETHQRVVVELLEARRFIDLKIASGR